MSLLAFIEPDYPRVRGAPTMHRLFAVQELVKLICEHCQDRDLRAVAYLARAFEGPALRALYMVLDYKGLWGLCKTFFGPYFETKSDRKDDFDHVANWTRFQTVAKLVLHLAMNSEHETVIHEMRTVRCLEQVYHSALALPIFPSLRSIDLVGPTFMELLDVRFLIAGGPPRLRSLQVRALSYYSRGEHDRDQGDLEFDVGSVWQLLPLKAPGLVRLTLDMRDWPLNLPEGAQKVYSELNHLEQITTRGWEVTDDFIVRLAASPRLRHLIIRWPTWRRAILPAMVPVSLPQHGFRALQVLELAMPPSRAAPILQIVPFGLLELSLHMRPKSSDSESSCLFDIKRIGAALHRFVSLTAFEFVLATIPDHPSRVEDDAYSPASIWKSLAPLYKCREIRQLHFRFQSDHRTSLHDQDIESVASAWPKLHMLRLVWWLPKAVSATDTSCTLQSLMHLRAHCPNLGLLELGSLYAEKSGALVGVPFLLTHTHVLQITVWALAVEDYDSLAVLFATGWAQVLAKLMAEDLDRAWERVFDRMSVIRRLQEMNNQLPTGWTGDKLVKRFSRVYPNSMSNWP